VKKKGHWKRDEDRREKMEQENDGNEREVM
jgi:hypothetical protein